MAEWYMDENGQWKKRKTKARMDEKGKMISIAPSTKKKEEKKETATKYKTKEAEQKANQLTSLDSRFAGLTYDQVQEEKKKYSKDSAEYKYLNNYTGYNNLLDFDKALEYETKPFSYNGERLTPNEATQKGLTVPLANAPRKLEVFSDSLKNRSIAPLAVSTPKQLTSAILGTPIQQAEQNEVSFSYDAKRVNELEVARNKYALDNKFDYYSHYKENDDYEEKSKYNPEKVKKNILGNMKKLDEVYYFANADDKEKAKYESSFGVDASMNMPEELTYVKYMSDDELGVFNYLFNTDKKKAEEYFEDIKTNLSRRNAKKVVENVQNFSDTAPVTASALSVPMNVFGGISGGVDTLISKAKGEEVDYYGQAYGGNLISSTIRNRVGQNIAENTKNVEVLGTNVPSFLYQTSMSMGDTIFGGAMFGKWYSGIAGSSAYQSKARELYEAGEDSETIEKVAIASGLTEVVFEYIELGKWLDTATAVGKKQILKRALTQAGVEGLSEGMTEISNIIIDTVGRHDNSELKQLQKELKEKGYTDEEIDKQLKNHIIRQVSEAVVGGAVSGGVLGGTKATIENKFTKSEQAFIHEKVQERVEAKESERGKKVSQKERQQIQDDVVKELRDGEFSRDEIEKRFGGESYTEYQKLVEEQREFNTLREMRNGDRTGVQDERLYELRKRNNEKSYSDRLAESRSKLSDVVSKATEKDKYFGLTYGERGKRGESFAITDEEKSKYTEQELKIVNKAVEMGEINNTRKAHDMVDFVAKVSTKLGVDFDFMNNKKLAEAGYVVEGKTIDGFKKGNAIAVNLQSKKALNSVVGHEITHVLDGTQLYDALQTTLKEYATTKGVYQSLFDTAKENYRNVYTDMTEDEYNAKIEQEVTSDLVGEYIFSDMDFVRNLSTKNPNVFQKVFNEIKYMLKVATAGSDAEKQLLKAKKIFEDVYRDTKRNTSEEVRYALHNDFQSKIDDWYNDPEKFKNSGGFIEVGRTSEALKSVGIKEQKVSFDKNKIKKILNDHPEMTIDIIKNVPYAIENPILIMQSKTALDSVTIYGEVYATVNGKEEPVMVAMNLKPKGKGGNILDVQKIASAYVRTDDNGNKATEKSQSLIDNSEILYVEPNKKRTNDWLVACGLQLPDGLTKYGSIGKVTYSDDFVNNASEDFGESVMADAFKRANINTSDTDFSLSDNNQDIAPTTNGIYGKDIRLERSIAPPVPNQSGEVTEMVGNVPSIAPSVTEQRVQAENEAFDEMYAPVTEEEVNAMLDSEENWYRMRSLQEAEEPLEIEDFDYDNDVEVNDPFDSRDIKDVGKRNVNAYMYDNPEVKPFYQEEARIMLGELQNTVKGERFYNDQLYYDTNGEQGFSGTSRMTSDEIAELLDNYNYSYADIEKGLKAIIEDHGAENIAVAKRIEFFLNERLLNGHTDFQTGIEIPRNQQYVNVLEGIQVNQSHNIDDLVTNEISIAPSVVKTSENIPQVRPIAPSIAESNERVEVHASQPLPLPQTEEVRGVRMNEGQPRQDNAQGNMRRWVGTSTDSEVVNREILPSDLDQSKIYYEPISNKKTLNTANTDLDRMGYDTALEVFNAKLENRTVSLSDIALGERLVQESLKRGDTKTTGELIQNIAILGTELGQKVQALSIIQRMTPEGQLKMLQKVVNRGKAKGDPAFKNVEITQEMIDKILAVYGVNGTYDQNKLNEAVESVKQDIADQMEVTTMDKVNAWRYLAMLGNPKTHIRNVVSNVTMQVTTEFKNAIARTVESIAPVKNRTKTWEMATDVVKDFAKQSTIEAKEMLTSENSYSESADIKAKRNVFEIQVLQKAYDLNNDLMTKEDWFFKKSAYRRSLQEFLTANGIKTQEDIQNNPELIEKGKKYATEQAQIATFQQVSWLANEIRKFENKNVVTQIGVGAVIPFKKTPINIAKTGLAYSPLGFAKSLSYDLHQMKQGNLEASQVIDNFAKGLTGSALVYAGYMFAMSGLLNGGGEEDKEGKYDYQLGEQYYSLNIGGNTYTLNWLSPVAMPLFVGANLHEAFNEDKDFTWDTTLDSLSQTLDPMTEMSFLSGLTSVLTSYEQGTGMISAMAETMLQNYATQFVPTLLGQVAQVTDDKKRSTAVSGDSTARMVEQTINKLKYKIPGLRQTLEPTLDIWGNETKQTENLLTRTVESFIAPYTRKDVIATEIDLELKDLYSQTGDNGVIPSVPTKKVKFKGDTYKMSADEYTDYKKVYGELANETLEDLFKTNTYKNSDADYRSELVNRVYQYASDEAKKDYLAKEGVEYTNTTQDNVPVYKTDKIKGAIENDMTLEEFDLYSKSKGSYYISKLVGGYDSYVAYSKELNNIEGTKNILGETINGTQKANVVNYLNNLNADYYTKIMLFKKEYPSDDRYNYEIVEYLNSRDDISYQEMVDILTELDFKVSADGTIRW